MKILFSFLALLFVITAQAQYPGTVRDRMPDRKGEYMVYRVTMHGNDSVIFFSLKNGDRVFAFAKGDVGRDLQLAKAGITFQDELQNKLKLNKRTVLHDKGGWSDYDVDYLEENIGTARLDVAYTVDGLFVDVRSKSVILFARKEDRTYFFNVTLKPGDDPNRKEKHFRSVITTKDYFTKNLILSPDGEFGYVDGRLYQFKKNKEVWSHLKRPQQSSMYSALSADGTEIALPNDDNRIDILKFKTGKRVRQLPPMPPVPSGYNYFSIAPASDMKTYVISFQDSKTWQKLDYMVFEDGTYKTLVL